MTLYTHGAVCRQRGSVEVNQVITGNQDYFRGFEISLFLKKTFPPLTPIPLPHRDPFTCSPNGEQVFISVFYNTGLRRARAEPLPKGCERFPQSSTMHTLQKGKKPWKTSITSGTS